MRRLLASGIWSRSFICKPHDMIAEVYPLRRMPRAIGALDYEIPDNMALKRGMFVTIPLRQRQVPGVVRRVKDTPHRGIRLRSVAGVLAEEGLRDAELSFFEELSRTHASSVSTLLYTSVPLPPKRGDAHVPTVLADIPLTVPQGEAATVARLAGQMRERRTAFVQAPDLKRAAAIISGYGVLNPGKKLFIVCPHVRDVRLLCQFLSSLSPLHITGEETNTQRYAVWRAYRQGFCAPLIASRAGLLFPDAQTSTVFVVRSGHPDHALHDRNPRLDAREVLCAFAQHVTASLFFLDVFPRPEDLFLFGEENFLSYPIASSPVWIDSARERPISSHVALCSSTLTAMTEAVQRSERVLVVYNQKGYARRLRCNDCGNEVRCGACDHPTRVHRHTIECIRCRVVAPVPLACPSCSSVNMDARGYGIERIAQALTEAFAHTQCALVDAEHPRDDGAQIVLATRFYLENVFDPSRPSGFGCVVHLDPDTPLFSPDFRASARALWSLAQWQAVAYATRAAFYVQTQEPQWFEKNLLNPNDFVRDELLQRTSYAQPPTCAWISVQLREPEARKREIALYQLREMLERIPGISADVEDDKMTVRTKPQMMEQMLAIFSSLDDRYIIDMNAFNG